jgi:hypothetical protein
LKGLTSAYLAGLIDGEGSIGIMKAKRKNSTNLIPYLIITNTDKNLIDQLNLALKEYHPQIISKQGWKKICYQIRMQGQQLRGLFMRIQPYLIIKKRHCEEVIGFINHRIFLGTHHLYTNSDWTSFQTLRILNQRTGRNYK